MRAMLVDNWRCGPRLAEGLLAVYGGHVLRAKNALGFLARDKAGFDAVSAFSPDALRGVIACRKAARSGAPAMAGFEGMLRELAERGFVAIGYGDSHVAELLSFYNIGGHTRQQEIPLTGKQLVATLGATLLVLPADAGNEQAIW